MPGGELVRLGFRLEAPHYQACFEVRQCFSRCASAHEGAAQAFPFSFPVWPPPSSRREWLSAHAPTPSTASALAHPPLHSGTRHLPPLWLTVSKQASKQGSRGPGAQRDAHPRPSRRCRCQHLPGRGISGHIQRALDQPVHSLHEVDGGHRLPSLAARGGPPVE